MKKFGRTEEDIEKLEKEIHNFISEYQQKLNELDKSIVAIIIEKIVEELLISTELNVGLKLQGICYDNEIYLDSNTYVDNDKITYFRIDLIDTIIFRKIQFLITLSKEGK